MADNKNREPTEHKLDKAREKGQIAQSQDLSRVVNVLVVGEILFATEGIWREALMSLMEFSHAAVNQPFHLALAEAGKAATVILLVVFFIGAVVCSVVSVTSHWGQFGILFAAEPITPKFDKINPVNGFKNIFSWKKLVELIETVIKSGLIALVIYLTIHAELANIVQLASGAPKDGYLAFITLLKNVFHVAIILCLVMAIIDFAIQKMFHRKEMMMDDEELKQEFKEMEGDPQIKGKRKQLAREWANEDPVAKTEKANAVVVNPTHFAVAMYYDSGQAMVPTVVAKGRDEVAAAMVRRAMDHGIPVIRHVWLARTLYATCRANMVVPQSSYEPVAYVYAVIHYLKTMDQVGTLIELEKYGDPPAAP
ncbi:MAG TPA: type III secretion system export apparatus subunit SctU [Noviherbaspirillum sp.]|uniref:type III secretion system export apparatus subunit SctU n=1 Tax=Noviherbaspirillum sp. TaxID=1926288 RepID=UPI002F950747